MKKAILSFILLFVGLNLFSSNDKPGKGFTINATVIDKQSGETIPGAKIELKGTSNYYYSDLDGKLILQSITKNDELIITATGYEPTNIKLSEVSLSGIIEISSR